MHKTESAASPLVRMADVLRQVNQILTLHSMWDGFWVHSFKRRNLVISAAFDRSVGRDFDIVFKKVSFFNLPASWRDDDVSADQMIRLASNEEFALQQPDFSTGDSSIFAFDIGWKIGQERKNEYTYYVVAKSVWVFKCEGEDRKWGGAEFKDPWAINGHPQLIDGKPCLMNRVTSATNSTERQKS